MQNLLNIKSLNTKQIMEICTLARRFQIGQIRSSVDSRNACLLFCENSTRTRFSFEMACHNLGMRVFNFDSNQSSFSKNETIKDAFDNLNAIGIELMIIRHSDFSLFLDGIKKTKNMKFICAGDGIKSHPTQALLDFYTMKRHFSKIENKKVTIVGDIAHSRVARSNIELLKKFNADIHLCAPDYFKDPTIQGVIWHFDLEEALEGSQVVMALRIQNERLSGSYPLIEYIKDYQLTAKNFPEDAILMHPGPVNRDVEITSELLDSKKGQTILEQAQNGVFVRMALIEWLLTSI